MRVSRRGIVAAAAVGLMLTGGAAAFTTSSAKLGTNAGSPTCIAIEGSFERAEASAIAAAHKNHDWALVRLLGNREAVALAANNC